MPILRQPLHLHTRLNGLASQGIHAPGTVQVCTIVSALHTFAKSSYDLLVVRGRSPEQQLSNLRVTIAFVDSEHMPCTATMLLHTVRRVQRRLSCNFPHRPLSTPGTRSSSACDTAAFSCCLCVAGAALPLFVHLGWQIGSKSSVVLNYVVFYRDVHTTNH